MGQFRKELLAGSEGLLRSPNSKKGLMKNWLKNNWFKIGLLLVLLVVISFGAYFYNQYQTLKEKNILTQQTQMSPDKIAGYKSQYLQEGEVAYGQLADSFNTDYTNEINQENQLCQTGEDSNVTVDNFDVNSLFGCWNHKSFILSKDAWVQSILIGK